MCSSVELALAIDRFRGALLGSRMGLIVDLKNMLDGELRVALSGGKTLVAEHFLNRAQVRAFLQHVGPERMPQGVRVNVGRQSFGHRDCLDDSPHAASSETAAPQVDQQCR
jgi:hypothetical protein